MTIRKFGKVGVLFLALVLALGGVGAAFAAWTDTLSISGTVQTGELEWELQGPITNSDPPLAGSLDWNCFFDLEAGTWVLMEKDVGSTVVELEDAVHPHSMTVTINNAYPYYGSHVAFKVHGLGTLPLKNWKANFLVDDVVIETIYIGDEYIYLDLDGDDVDDFEIWWERGGFGEQLHFCDKDDISFEMLVLQPMAQNQQGLSFTIELVAIQWNKYEIPPG